MIAGLILVLLKTATVTGIAILFAVCLGMVKDESHARRSRSFGEQAE